jgi:hypothetical protein
MFRRLFWFGLGILAGVYGTAWMKRKAAEIGERLTLASALQVVTDVSKFLIDKLLELWKKDADVAMKPQDGSPQS